LRRLTHSDVPWALKGDDAYSGACKCSPEASAGAIAASSGRSDPRFDPPRGLTRRLGTLGLTDLDSLSERLHVGRLIARNVYWRLKETLALNQPLATAYYLKEDMRRFWDQPGKSFATTFLDGWIRRAEASGIKILQQIAKTLAAHRTGLLAYYDVMISSGPMEGNDNKIKTMKRQAYGFRDMEFFKFKILAIHETRSFYRAFERAHSRPASS
jgi:Transposase